MNVEQNKQVAKAAAQVAQKAAEVSAEAEQTALRQEAEQEKSSLMDKFNDTKERASEMLHDKTDGLKYKVKDVASKGLAAAANMAESLADKARNAADSLGK